MKTVIAAKRDFTPRIVCETTRTRCLQIATKSTRRMSISIVLDHLVSPYEGVFEFVAKPNGNYGLRGTDM